MDAKVDIRKLQLLNDRINQTIEVLNQVRFAIQTLPQQQQQPYFPQFADPMTQQFSHWGNLGGNLGVHPATMGPGGAQPIQTPMQHSSGVLPNAYPFANPYGAALSPFGQQFGQQGLQHSTGYGVQNPAQSLSGYGGLGHTSPELLESYRLAQTFPFAFGNIGIGRSNW